MDCINRIGLERGNYECHAAFYKQQEHEHNREFICDIIANDRKLFIKS